MWFSATLFVYQGKDMTKVTNLRKKNTFKREKDERIESLKVCNQLPSSVKVRELIHDQ